LVSQQSGKQGRSRRSFGGRDAEAEDDDAAAEPSWGLRERRARKSSVYCSPALGMPITRYRTGKRSKESCVIAAAAPPAVLPLAEVNAAAAEKVAQTRPGRPLPVAADGGYMRPFR
jgi:hypothetical protein